MRSALATGYEVISDPAHNTPVEYDLKKCSHCGYQMHVPPFQTPEGWCDECGEYICHKPACHAGCSHFMRKIEAAEKAHAASLQFRRDMEKW